MIILFHCEGRMVLERTGMALHHAKIAKLKKYISYLKNHLIKKKKKNSFHLLQIRRTGIFFQEE